MTRKDLERLLDGHQVRPEDHINIELAEKIEDKPQYDRELELTGNMRGKHPIGGKIRWLLEVE